MAVKIAATNSVGPLHLDDMTTVVARRAACILVYIRNL